MSLIHWWPLTEDLNDKIGLTPLVSSKWFLENDSTKPGKIGKCYNANEGGIAKVNILTIPNTFSFACWIKNYDLTYPRTTLPIYFGAGEIYQQGNAGWDFGHGANGEQGRRKYRITLNDGTNAPFNFYWDKDGYNPNNLLNTWYHIAATVEYDKKKITLYINGHCLGEQTISENFQGFAGTRQLVIGNLSGWTFFGHINDLRIYDHALSAAEVQELKKALVMHYTFNDPLIEATTNLLYEAWPHTNFSQAPLGTYTSFSRQLNGGSCEIVQFNGIQCLRLQALEGSQTGRIYSTYDLTANKTYTIAFDYYSSVTHNQALHTEMHGGDYTWRGKSCAYTTPNQWKRLSMTLTPTSNTKLYIFAYAKFNYYAYINNIQLEEKDHATPYTISNRAAMLQNETGLIQPTVVNNISLSPLCVTGTYSSYFNGNDSYIDTPTIKANLFQDDYTLTFWTYPLDDGRAIYFGDYNTLNTSSINFERTASGSFRYYHASNPDWIFSELSAPINTWTMLSVVYTPGTLKLFKNGELKRTQSHTASLLKNINSIMRIGRDERVGSTALWGYIDDFRFYTTALTNQEIKELYDCGGRISNLGDALTGEFIETLGDNLVTTADWQQKSLYDANGRETPIMTNRLCTNYIPVLPNTAYYYAANDGIRVRNRHYYTKDLEWLGCEGPVSNAIVATTPENCYYVRWILERQSNSQDLLISGLETYGATMTYAGTNNTVLSLSTKQDIKVNKNHTIVCLDINENQKASFMSNGKLTCREIIEI